MTLLLILLLLCNHLNVCGEGFAAKTLIKTAYGYTTIEQIKIGDIVTSFNSKQDKPATSTVSAVSRDITPKIIRILMGSEFIDVAPDQKFFVPFSLAQCSAQAIKNSPALKSRFITHGFFDDIVEIEKETTVYKLTIEPDHNFYVSKRHMLAHNFIPIVGLGIAFGSGIEFFSSVTISAFISSVACWLLKEFIEKKADHNFSGKSQQSSINSSCPIMDPEDDEKDRHKKSPLDGLEQKRAEADRLAKKMGFKQTKNYKFNSHGEKVYQKGRTQISRDKHIHKGGFWKAFRSGSPKRIGTFNKDLTIKIGG
jgi:hypothetical protein